MDLRTGSVAEFSVRGATPGGLLFWYVSFYGPGPLPAPFERVFLSFPIDLLIALPADPSGALAIPIPIPRGLIGLDLWSQCVELRATELHWSNALALRVR